MALGEAAGSGEPVPPGSTLPPIARPPLGGRSVFLPPPRPVPPRFGLAYRRLVVRWLIVLLTTVLGAMSGLIFTALSQPRYSAQSAVVISVQGPASRPAAAQDYTTAFSRVAVTPTVLGAALAQAGISNSAQAVRRRIQLQVSPDAPVIGIVGSAQTPADAATLANALANGFANYGTAHAGDTGYQVAVLTRAVPPRQASAPRASVDLLAGTLVGFALGCLASLVARPAAEP
jgi:capsular polysaccharide biosynthesis protein